MTSLKLLILSTCLIALVGCHNQKSIKNISVTPVDLANPQLEVTILDTGKSDCILIEMNHHNIMIDTGLDQNGEQILDTLSDKGIKQIDYLILTHLDKDHIGGADIILDETSVKHVIQPNYIKESNQYQEYINALSRHNITPLLLTENLDLVLDNSHLTLYPAQQSEYEQSNDYSIITSLIYGDNSFLFAGDAESQRLTEFLNTSPATYKFLKVPHHGKYDDILPLFLDTIHPEYAVITCSDENIPNNRVISILNKIGTHILLTSDGEINIKCNDSQMFFTQQLTQYISLEYN